MTTLKRLREAKNLNDFAPLLGFTPSGLAFILYKLPVAMKYKSFDIPKQHGGVRHIKAPEPRLALLQRRLATSIYDCLDELKTANAGRRSLAHGFERSRSIITNASLHKRRRYVLNLDLKDFFPSINFGRVRGFFIKDRYFSLHPVVATAIAQIACHENELPQGSPCSPVISNLIGHLLDTRLASFAKLNKCTYSRYADDITFSTSRKNFPAGLAALLPGSAVDWRLGKSLVDIVERSGFQINHKKTRMQLRSSRQVATGLMLNEKVNIRPEYYRLARSMCCHLFSHGVYYRMIPATLKGGSAGAAPHKEVFEELDSLEGILSHVYQVKNHSDLRSSIDKKKMPSSTRNLYGKFLFYRNFVANDSPVILPEGKTDSVYLKAAIRALPKFHSVLGRMVAGRWAIWPRFLNYSSLVHDVLQLGGGTGDLKHFIRKYKDDLKAYRYAPLKHPVIVLVDNDEGAKDVFAVIKGVTGMNILISSTAPFYHIVANLYVVKTPEVGTTHSSCIEDLFEPSLLATVVDGRKFDPKVERGQAGKYGKVVFAEKVVRPNVATIDFSRFVVLLDRIVAALDHYASARAGAPTVLAAGP
jgi:hypothetical protein